MIAPEDRCDLCHKPAAADDSDLALCPHCRAELWLHSRCAASGGGHARGAASSGRTSLLALSGDLSPLGDTAGLRLVEDRQRRVLIDNRQDAGSTQERSRVAAPPARARHSPL